MDLLVGQWISRAELPALLQVAADIYAAQKGSRPMPVQKTVSGLLAKLGERGRKAHEQFKDAPVQLGNARLPAGIENGVAQLREIKFGEFKEGDNKGQLFFMAAGVVIAPKMHDGVVIEGQRTQVGPIPLCDTPKSQGKKKTFADHYADMLNYVKMLLGPDAQSMEYEDLEGLVAAIKEARPYFKFRTWKGQKQTTGPYAGKEPRVNEEWNGHYDYAGNGQLTDESESDLVDHTIDEGDVMVDDEAPPQFDEFGDLDSLLEKAIEEDEAAQTALRDLALKAGYDEETVDGAEDWAAVVELINNPIQEAGTEETEPEPEPEPPAEWAGPSKGEAWGYTVLDPKTKKPVVDRKTKKALKPVEVEVLSVDKKTKTCTLKNMDDGKTKYEKVKWDDLVEVPKAGK